MALHCIARCATVLKIACNSNSRKEKKKNMNCIARCTTVLKIAGNSISEKAIAAFFNTVVHEGKRDYFYKLPTGFLSASSSLKHLFPCFEHFYARNIAKIRLRFAIWAFSSLRIQICSLEAGFKTRKISYLPMINAIPTPADTLKGLRCNYFLLISMYLLRQYIY